MQSNAATVEEYIASLPADRRLVIEAVRKVIKRNLGKGFEEGMQYGMIGYYVPHSLYSAGYHCDPRQPLPFAGLASQKQAISVHMYSVYAGPAHERFVAAWKATGKKLDMGKCCVRFKRLEDAALEPIGAAIKAMGVKEFIAHYEAARAASGTNAARKATKPAAAGKLRAAQSATATKTNKKPVAKEAAAQRTATKKAASKTPAAEKSRAT